jgi:LacI family transcriptional regulator
MHDTTLSRPVTTKDLARRLSVSRATVSIVLNGRAQQRNITPETTQRVLEAARELGYIPNQAARTLRRQRSGVIGVVLADFSMDWAERVMTGMLAVFDPGGFTPFVATHRFDPARQRKELMAALQRHDEGVICQPLPGQEDCYREFQGRGVPLVFLGDEPAGLPEVSSVCWDAGAAARTVVQHLVQTGRRRIGHIGFTYPLRFSQARVAAYQAVLSEAGLHCDERWSTTLPASLGASGIVAAALERAFAPGIEHPDALFVLNDHLALTALEALEQRGLRVPEDVALVGMGDLPCTAQRGIGLTTVREPCEELGRAAAETVLDLVGAPMRAPISCLISCTELMARRTSAAAAPKAKQRGM